jgi:two-component system, NtrC family, sensor kinase
VEITSEISTDGDGEGEAIENGSVRIFVRDNGIGFEEKYLDRIFTPFQRLHGRNEYEGTGIGLAVCRKIVERHGGTLTAVSSVGEGSTFIATIPLKQNKEKQ